MNLVDSSGWLEYLADGKNAGRFAPAIEKTDELIVSVINVYEVYKKILAERDESIALSVVSLMYRGHVIAVDSNIALQAAELSHQKKIPMADSIIYISAKVNDAELWTQDIDLKGLPGVKYFKK